MSINYSGVVRRGRKVIRLPVKPAPRLHSTVNRARQGLQQPIARIIDISEHFAAKLHGG
jgi:hypothetical protein